MRMNPRNIVFIVALIAVMVVLIVIGTRGGEGDATPTPDSVAETGSLLPEIEQESLNRFEIRELPQSPDEDATEEPTETPSPTPLVTPAVPQPTAVPEGPAETIIRKNADGFWVITEATYATDREVDQVTVTGSVGIVLELEYADRFSLEETGGEADVFGLTEPQYEIILASTDEEYRILLGNKNPAGTRYYTQLSDDTDTVYLVAADLLDNIVNYIEEPPYVPPPTPTPTATRTPNPFSEVEQTQTAEAGFMMTETAIATLMGEPEQAVVGPAVGEDGATEEVVETEEATEESVMTEEATEAMTEEPTEEAVETEEATEES